LTDGQSVTMPKVSMKNANRKNEFLEAAQALFNEKGFENTSVEDIVQRMGVAKGLFYYYFKSKEELLQIIVERLIDEIESSVIAVMEKKGITALERFRELVMASSDVASRGKMLIAYFHQERNQAIHLSMESRSRAFLIPVMERIIEQGNQEGLFKVKYPLETAIALMATMTGIKQAHPCSLTTEESVRMTIVLQDLTERLLGMHSGTFTLYQEMLPPEMKTKIRNDA
jgi:AcrR family transcriptional regulator